DTRHHACTVENPSPTRSHITAAKVSVEAPKAGESETRTSGSEGSRAAAQPLPTPARRSATAATIQVSAHTPKFPRGGAAATGAAEMVAARTRTPGATWDQCPLPSASRYPARL